MNDDLNIQKKVECKSSKSKLKFRNVNVVTTCNAMSFANVIIILLCETCDKGPIIEQKLD